MYGLYFRTVYSGKQFHLAIPPSPPNAVTGSLGGPDNQGECVYASTHRGTGDLLYYSIYFVYLLHTPIHVVNWDVLCERQGKDFEQVSLDE